MNPWIVIQARTGSRRLPGKVLLPLGGRTVLEWVVERCRQSRRSAGILVATTVLPSDEPVAQSAAQLGLPVHRGSEEDVLARYVEAAQKVGADCLIRITADCPLIDPTVIDRVAELYLDDPADYTFVEGYPDGLGAAELLTSSALARSLWETTPEEVYYREHVMTYLVAHPEKFRLHFETAPEHLRQPHIHLSVDESEDLEVVRAICDHFAPRTDFRTPDILDFLSSRPDLLARATRERKNR